MTLGDSVGEKWQELSGQNYWKGLIDPLNIDFRRYIIHYGEMAQATYDAFNTERASKYAGSCLYRKSEFFKKVDLKHGKLYTVTKFLYATSSIPLIPDIFMVKSFSREAWSKESNWIGYVAVATDEGKEVLGRRDIVIAWRGTVQNMEWVNDLQFVLLPAPQVFPSSGLLITSLLTNPKVHQGWYNIYTSSSERSPFNQTSVREQATSEVQRLVKLYKGEEVSITITGHSLGAAVATLNAVDIVANGFNKGAPVSAFVFASPGVGDINFKRVVSEYKDLRIFRIENVLDIVPKYPPLGYFNVGEGLMINTQKSGYLKLPGDITSWHSLEAYLHGVAGTQGASIIIGAGEFKLDVDRDIALVNKSLDALKDEYLVPASWWVLKNKGMTKQSDGTWKLEENKEDKEDCF